ncbi:hypothetical protein DYB28_009713, partial [Aphanomyces astaci]
IPVVIVNSAPANQHAGTVAQSGHFKLMTANNITTGATTDAAAADAKARTSQLRRAIFLMVLINIVLPIVLFAIVSKYIAEVWALLLSGVPPALEAIVHVLRDRRLDLVPCAVVVSIVVSAGVAAATSDARLLLVKDSFLTVGFGLTFLGSMCLTNENLIWYYNRQFNGPEAKARLDAMYAYPAVKQATTTMCWVWGGGLLAEAAVRIVLIYVLEVHVMAYASPDALGLALEVPCYEATAAVLGDGWTCGKFAGGITSSTPMSSSLPPTYSFKLYVEVLSTAPAQVSNKNKIFKGVPKALEVKIVAAIVFCTQVQNAPLLDDMVAVARFVLKKDNVTTVDEEAWVNELKAFGQDDDVAAFTAGSVQHTLYSQSACGVAQCHAVRLVRRVQRAGSDVGELGKTDMANWLAVLQILHRLYSFYDVYGN